MSRTSYLFTSESVSEGHPDKVCDRISDEVVDAFLALGPRYGWDARNVRVACETLATTNRVVIAGETRGPSSITKDYVAHLARLAIRDIGYEQAGFHWEKADVEVHLHAQSADIAVGENVEDMGARILGLGTRKHTDMARCALRDMSVHFAWALIAHMYGPGRGVRASAGA